MAHYDVSTSQKKTNPELVAGGTLYSDAPVGCVLAFCGVIAPSGWFICDGSELNRDDFPELFNVIGTAFGTPSANTKFKLPDLRESTIKGAGLTGLANNHMDSDGLAVGEFINDRLQNHSHNTYLTGVQISSGGAWATAHDYSTPGTHTSNPETPARIGDTTEVKAVGANWIIKAQQTALPLDLYEELQALMKPWTLANSYTGVVSTPQKVGNLNGVKEVLCIVKDEINLRHTFSFPVEYVRNFVSQSAALAMVTKAGVGNVAMYVDSNDDLYYFNPISLTNSDIYFK